MPAFEIERSIRIDAPESQVRSAVADFKEWPIWSPWLCMEPAAELTYHGNSDEVGHGYQWSGELVGAGKMEIAAIEGSLYKMDLEFLKPWRSQAKVSLELKPVDGQIEVVWRMQGSMPWFLFFMVGQMKIFIGMDYERGLKMMKEYCETGGVKSEIEIVGIVDFPETPYIGVRAEASMEEIGASMEKTIPQTACLLEEHGLEADGPPSAIYNKVDLKKKRCCYTTMIPLQSEADVAGAVCGKVPACKALKIVHTGSYQNLGNAWSTLMSYQRSKKLKPLKSQPAFEMYVSDPGETPEEAIRTEIYMPLRG